VYRSAPPGEVEHVANFAVEYFRQRIRENPGHLENYLLLSNCYLYNDDAINAELTLRDAIRLAPNCVLLYQNLLEAYSRGDKKGEVSATQDKIYALDRNLPAAIDYKFEEYLKAEKNDKAEEMLQQLESLLPESERVFDLSIELYAQKRLGEKVIELTHRAHEKFPDDARYAIGEARTISRASKRPSDAIEILEAFIDRRYSQSVQEELAKDYLALPDMKKWRRAYDRLLEFSPTATGYYYQMALAYINAEQYGEAEGALRKAMEIRPGSAGLWSKLGEVQRRQRLTSDAIASYRKALEYDPTDYETRSILRELEGKKSIQEQFQGMNVDSLIEHAATEEDYPEERAVVLLDDARRVVYRQGGSESTQELVVRVFNDLGIDDWKEYTIGYNSYNEDLTIEKAEVVKSDRSIVKADVDDNHVVFTTVEPGDILHLKWHIRNHYNGRLANQFWDSYNFNGFYPTQHVRYSLIAPEGFHFDYGAQNMPSEPARSNVDDGTLYRWSLDDVPAVAYEYGMPTLQDVGKMLYISSMGGWDYLVGWYADLAQTKARSSYEVKEKVAEILSGRESASNEEKVRLVYEFITDNIRYSSVGFRQGAYIPQKARDVLTNKIGDCKDVATLCIAMLSEAGIRAHYVLVNTRDYGSNRNALPSIVFNHCIVEVDIDGRERFLDLTANNFSLGSMPNDDREAFALVIKPGVKGPVYLPAASMIPRNATVTTVVDVHDDNTIVGDRHNRLTGSLAASVRSALRHQAGKDQRKKILTGLSATYPGVKLVKFGAENLDNLQPEVHYFYTYEAPLYVSEAGTYKFLKVPWDHPAYADEALSYVAREYPYEYWPSADTMTEEVEIHLPQGYQPIDLPKGAQFHSAVADYSLNYTVSGDKIVARRRLVNKKAIVSTEDYPEFKLFYNNVVKEDMRQILLKPTGKKTR
jgi:cytochrome c-type biogenesis protein CcmH/NrfG/transglutaminase-like putative cysteine protease